MQYLAAPTMESKILEMLSLLRLARLASGVRPAAKPLTVIHNQVLKISGYCLSFDVKQNERNKTKRRSEFARRFGGRLYTTIDNTV